MQKEVPEIRVPYDYVLPDKPKRNQCRLCNTPRAVPPLQLIIHFLKGWSQEVDVCTGCFHRANEMYMPGEYTPMMHEVNVRAVVRDKAYAVEPIDKD